MKISKNTKWFIGFFGLIFLVMLWGRITDITGNAFFFFLFVIGIIIAIIVIYWKIPQSRGSIKKVGGFTLDLFTGFFDTSEDREVKKIIKSERKASRKAVSKGMSRDLFENASNRCQYLENNKRCPYKKSNNLVLHHINHIPSFSEEKNLIVICPNHHTEIHRDNKWNPPESPTIQHIQEIVAMLRMHSKDPKVNEYFDEVIENFNESTRDFQ